MSLSQWVASTMEQRTAAKRQQTPDRQDIAAYQARLRRAAEAFFDRLHDSAERAVAAINADTGTIRQYGFGEALISENVWPKRQVFITRPSGGKPTYEYAELWLDVIGRRLSATSVTRTDILPVTVAERLEYTLDVDANDQLLINGEIRSPDAVIASLLERWIVSAA